MGSTDAVGRETWLINLSYLVDFAYLQVVSAASSWDCTKLFEMLALVQLIKRALYMSSKNDH